MRKTIRMNKKQFFVMMIVTPFFAAYTAVLTFMLILQPWKSETPVIEVPILGEVEDKTDEKTEENTEETQTEEVAKQEEQPVEEQKPVEQPAEQKPVTVNAIQKSLIVQPKTTQKTEQPKKTEVKTEPKQVEKPVEKPAEKPAEKSAEEIAKETCEATKSEYKTFISVHFFDIFEQFYLKALGVEKENPVVDYKKFVVKNGETAEMIYENKTCKPSKANLELIDDLILDNTELEQFGISAKSDYEIWQ